MVAQWLNQYLGEHRNTLQFKLFSSVSRFHPAGLGEPLKLETMRRIDVLGIGIGVFLVGGGLYVGFRIAGLDSLSAGVWSQVLFVGGLLGWVATYLTRVVNKDMTYNKQVKEYEDAVLQKRLDEMTPEELSKLQAELAEERSGEEGE